MLSKAKIKQIHSLALKKNRDESRLFIAERPKVVEELLGHFPCRLLAATSTFLTQHRNVSAGEIIEATEDELERATLLQHAREVIAIFEQPSEAYPTPNLLEGQLTLALDDVQDPGNVGTIIRLADWFGIKHILASYATADAFSSKVVQATMGALARVRVHYCNLSDTIAKQKTANPSTKIYGTFLNGDNLYTSNTPKPSETGIIVMGNEGNGISPEIEALVNQRLTIPPFPQGASTSESLNVAIATAITCAEFRRRQY